MIEVKQIFDQHLAEFSALRSKLSELETVGAVPDQEIDDFDFRLAELDGRIAEAAFTKQTIDGFYDVYNRIKVRKRRFFFIVCMLFLFNLGMQGADAYIHGFSVANVSIPLAWLCSVMFAYRTGFFKKQKEVTATIADTIG